MSEKDFPVSGSLPLRLEPEYLKFSDRNCTERSLVPGSAYIGKEPQSAKMAICLQFARRITRRSLELSIVLYQARFMRNKILSLVCLVTLLSAPLSFAGYDKTSWGMGFNKLKKLYPGGQILKNQNGSYVYGVIKSVAGMSTGYVNFDFTSGNKLDSVTILFPVQGAKVDLKTGNFYEPTDADATQISSNLRTALTQKYGQPKMSKESDMVWFDKDTAIILSETTSKVPGHRTPAVLYRNQSSPSESANGL